MVIFCAVFNFDFVLSCTGLIAWKIVCRGKGLLLPASTLLNATQQVMIRRSRRFCPGWILSVRTAFPPSIVVLFQPIAGLEVVGDLILPCHLTAVPLSQNLVISTCHGKGVLTFVHQSVTVLLAIIDQTFDLCGQCESVDSLFFTSNWFSGY